MRSALIAALAGLLLLEGGCREEGPAEKAGRKVDEAVEKLKHGDEGTLEKAGRKLDEAVDEVGEAIEELGEDLQGD